MKYKKFNSDLFDLTDSPAREATKQYLSRMGQTAIDNPNKYCADLIIEDLCYAIGLAGLIIHKISPISYKAIFYNNFASESPTVYALDE